MAVSTASADPLRTPACLSARQALGDFETAQAKAAAAESAAATVPAERPAPTKRAVPPRAVSGPNAAAPGVPPRLRALRAEVARTCLASSLDAPRPQRQPQAPVAVPPVAIAPPSGLAPLLAAPGSAPRSNPGPGAQPPLRSITSCDAAGCWASDGTRLQRMGPSLVGPQGVCNVSGNVAVCP